MKLPRTKNSGLQYLITSQAGILKWWNRFPTILYYYFTKLTEQIKSTNRTWHFVFIDETDKSRAPFSGSKFGYTWAAPGPDRSWAWRTAAPTALWTRRRGCRPASPWFRRPRSLSWWCPRRGCTRRKADLPPWQEHRPDRLQTIH